MVQTKPPSNISKDQGKFDLRNH